MTNNEIQSANRFIRAKECAARFGVSISTWWNWNNAKSRHYRPELPRPVKVSANCTAWLESELDDFTAKLAAERSE